MTEIKQFYPKIEIAYPIAVIVVSGCFCKGTTNHHFQKGIHTMFDIAVIGGGPAGMMAAIHASKTHKVILLEKNDSLGKKLLLTGGGRCNVTNNIPIENLISNIIGNGKFLYSAFSKFDNQDIIQFFQSRNNPLKEEDNGRIFPVSNSSKTILSALKQELQKNNVSVRYHARVIDWKVTEHHIDSLVLEDNSVIQAKNYILATGGMSFSHTGSNGDGYRLAQKLGHTVTDLYPSEVALTSKESFIQAQTLKGLSLQNIELKCQKQNCRYTTFRHHLHTLWNIGTGSIEMLRFCVETKRKRGYPLLRRFAEHIQSRTSSHHASGTQKSTQKYIKKLSSAKVCRFYLYGICRY